MTQNGSTTLDDGPAGPAGGGGLLFPNPTTTATQQQQLPRSSRAFEMFMSRATLDTMANQDPLWNRSAEPESPDAEHAFPRPSYLEGSHYLARLEAQEREKGLILKDVAGSSSASGGGGNGIPRGKAPAAPAFHMGIAMDVVERIPGGELGRDVIDALPTKWATCREDKAQTLEVMGAGLEVKYSGPKSPQERDFEAYAIRADHPMPLQCGLYYFEVTVLTKRHTE